MDKNYRKEDLLHVIYNYLLPVYNYQHGTNVTLEELIKQARVAKLPILLTNRCTKRKNV